jgi:ABC-type multidrug transport system fused ATPase/permease subunit
MRDSSEWSATAYRTHTIGQVISNGSKILGDEVTILIIAHRLSTLKGCDQIFELSKDGILMKQMEVQR